MASREEDCFGTCAIGSILKRGVLSEVASYWIPGHHDHGG